MKINNFGFDAPRAQATIQRILADIERRGPLPQLNLVFQPTAFNYPVALGKTLPMPALTCLVTDTDEAFHAGVVDTDPKSDELTMLLTHTNGRDVGFKTTYQFLPEAAVFVSFDILKFFYERVPVLADKDEAGIPLPSPVFHKHLEVENILKPVYADLPEEYTWVKNIEARKNPATSSLEWHPKEKS